MKAGKCAAVITISASKASNAPQTLVVNLSISPPEQEEQEEQEKNVIDALDTDKLLEIGYNYPEQVVTVEGIVVGTYYAEKSNGQPTFLDFHDPYEGYFKCIIWRKDRQTGEFIRDKFIEAFSPNPETYFLSRKVRVEGTITVYHRWRDEVCLCEPEIILCDPSQIWIVE
jgi:micrococcal nuclease